MSRIFITTADIMQLSGKSLSSAWREMQTIKDALGKTKKQVLTIKEYCHYNGIEESEIEKIIKK
jgi:predicted DNA-binding transcriptional regulator AlpA